MIKLYSKINCGLAPVVRSHASRHLPFHKNDAEFINVQRVMTQNNQIKFSWPS